jgi:hypothetical protein
MKNQVSKSGLVKEELCKECIGCITYDQDLKECLLSGSENLDECPCRKCIVKTMCTNACDLYSKYHGCISTVNNSKVWF